ncbi:MAG: CusA/CzcA family heavy metal efflux RND transporter [Bdellovibrionales bacterium]|nr:CusA/CzcA family heavy metal efflux RND transporter [Bdellovibrionales bacterium]
MLERVLAFSVERRWLVLVLAALIAGIGVYRFEHLPIDAVPDITNVQVQVNTEAPGYTPLEVEQQITFPIETALAGLPSLDYTRSLSRYGLSQVTVVFQDGTDIYFARQLISERLQEVKEALPESIVPAMGPIATGLGEIYMYSLHPREGVTLDDPTLLRSLQDWVVKPQLRTVRGVIEVNTVGGYVKQYHITPDPKQLMTFGLSFEDVRRAVEANNANVGAGFVERNGEQLLVRAPGRVVDSEGLGRIMVANREGRPILVSDVADVAVGHELRSGAATEQGKEAVLGTVFMLMGENSRTVAKAVDEKIEQIRRSLPDEIELRTVYDRTNLINATIWTVRNNLAEGALLVIAVLFLMLGSIRAALITAMVIPLSMLFTVSGMVSCNITANLMSLGALDFGLIVDGSVIIVENCVRRLREARHELGRALSLEERLQTVYEASREVRRATMFGELIILTVYLPILTLTGVEGKMFQPMAVTVILALFGAMVFSLTFVPAAVALFVDGRGREREGLLGKLTKQSYLPLLQLALRGRWLVVGLALALVALAGVGATNLGSEFMPQLDEGDVALHAIRIPGAGLEQSVEMQKRVELALQDIPEVELVFSKIGTPDIATDPMPPSVADGFVILKPRSAWPNPGRPKAAVVQELQEVLTALPGNAYEFTQPIEMRFNELIAGVRSDVAVKVFGDDLEILAAVARDIEQVMRSVEGAEDVRSEQVSGLPVLSVDVKHDRLYRFGLSVDEVQQLVQTAIGGSAAGEIIEGDRRVPIVVRLPEELRQDVRFLEHLPVKVEHGYVPLGEVADIRIAPGPNQVSREQSKRRLVVTANVRARDLGSFVEELEETIAAKVDVPSGYWLTYGGQFEHLTSAKQRLQIIVPAALGLIALLLFISLGTWRDTLLVFSGIPLAMTGGVAALWLREIPFSISAGVGFIALSGVAVLNGLVMVTFIKDLRAGGMPLEAAVLKGSLLRLRPVLMTALVASLGFVPMALAESTGAEVQRPLATVVIGGIVSSTLLTLIVLPVLYVLWAPRENS